MYDDFVDFQNNKKNKHVNINHLTIKMSRYCSLIAFSVGKVETSFFLLKLGTGEPSSEHTTVYKNPDKICQDLFLECQDFFLENCHFMKILTNGS